ncbi:hypothetical protein [Morganella morganii]|uniref:hypothetical protein n=1 Tax=Morganella morganii TaxID=582 RepID=UPI000BBD04B2|nr:hypothetical protein [Morganella morganii]ATF52944.1 hypothetical protein CO693_04095 [Morganella morganii]
MIRIDKKTGSQLMRLWGVLSWPEIDAEYWLWHGCCIFVTIDHGDSVDLHMAMRKSDRRRCRDAVSEMLHKIGNRTVNALIEVQFKKVENLAVKMGFTRVGEFKGVRLDGSEVSVIKMVRCI